MSRSRPSPPRVLLVGNFLSRHLATRAVSEDLAERLGASGTEVITTSHRLARPARLADFVLTPLVRRRDYDVGHVDVHSGAAFLWAEAAAWSLRRAGRPYVLTLHGGNLPELARRRPARMRRLLRGAAAVTTPSRYLLEALGPLAPAPPIHLPNPLELSRYRFRRRDLPAPRLVWLRAFHHLYHPTLAVEVAARLAPRFPEIHLAMVGPDKGDGSLEATRRRAVELGVADRIDLPGPVPKERVPEVLGAADIFLNTTEADNTPVSVMEALASGLPVVSTDAGGLPHLLHDGTDALLAPRGDARALAGAVERLLTEPGLAGRLSAAGRRKAQGFDWGVVLPRWQELFAQVLAGVTGGADGAGAARTGEPEAAGRRESLAP